MKMTLSLIALFIMLFSNDSFSQEASVLTNGLNEYWDPTEEQLFAMFRKKYWSARGVNHHLELYQTPLFIRLEEENEKIEALRKYGKSERADELEKKIKKQNRNTIDYIKEAYPGSDYYFYFGEDAEALFLDQDYSKLLTDIDTAAENVSIDKIAYVLMYTTYDQSLNGKAYWLYLWDKEKVSKLKDFSYLRVLSFLSRADSSLKKFCSKVKRAQP